MKTQHEYLVLSALGEDQPGLVARVTRFLVERGCSIEESRMVLLGGEFGILALVSGPTEKLHAVSTDLRALQEETGLTATAKRTSSPAIRRQGPVLSYSVTAHSLDHEGIVHAVSEPLFRLGANIVAVDTSAYNAPVTGSPLFRMEALIDVPATLPISRVREAMARVAEAQNLDIDVSPAALVRPRA